MDNELKLLHKDIKDYNIKIDPLKEYLKQAMTYLKVNQRIGENEAKEKLRNTIKKCSFTQPVVKYRVKNQHGDMVNAEGGVLDYIKDAQNNNEIIVPSLTTYIHPDKQKSVHSEFMQHNVNRRSKYKKEAFRNKQDGMISLFNYNNTMQKTMKIFNNSLSGAYASKSTVLRNQSAHYTLTSMTRCLSSIGNSVSESFLIGNMHFRDSNSVFNYITAIIANMNTSAIARCVEKYNLAIPTVENIMDNIKKCSKYYWWDENIFKDIQDYVSKLNELQRVAVMYTNNFWHIKEYNQDLIRNFLKRITLKVEEPVDNATEILTKLPEDILILVKIICSEDIMGDNLDITKLNNTNLGNTLASTAKNVIKNLNYINFLFHTFFLTDVLPINIAYIREMMRDAIVLSDTDSTCGSYDMWTQWYFGEPTLNTEAVNITAVIMTLNSRAIDHGLRILSKNMNIPEDRLGLLKMKNEFFWNVFITGNKNKHYFANTLIQEGNVFKEPDFELKGVHLIASAANKDVTKKIVSMMKEINATIAKGEPVELLKYVKAVADLERELLKRIEDRDISVFKFDKIKEKNSYKSDNMALTPYIHHVMWEEVFAEKYGHPGNPPYMAIKIPTTLQSRAKTLSFINSIKDEDIKTKLLEYVKKYNKDMLGTFKPAAAIVGSKGIPSELIPCIDKRRIVMDNLNSAYIVLEALGFYKKTKILISEMGY